MLERRNETRQYDLQGRLTTQFIGTADTRVYGYDLNGNLLSKQTLPDVASYTYDPQDRLTNEVTLTDTNAFTYDPNGNRITDLKNNGTVRPYTYDPNSNRLNLRGTQAWVLDAAGNTLSDRGGKRVYTYNNAGRLATVTKDTVLRGTYTYNAQGQRTRKIKVTNTGKVKTFVYHYDLQGHLIAETKADGTPIRAYVWANALPLAQIKHKATTNADILSFIHTDHLATPRLATNATQTPVWRREAQAFGTGTNETDPDGDGIKVNVRLRFPGQYKDGESGLVYNWNRYYDPRMGRYVTSDPIGLFGGLNTYLYVGANPLRFIDPTGEAAQIPAFIAAICARFPQMCASIARGAGKIAKACRDLLKRGKRKVPNKPDGIPDDWIAQPTKKGGGTKYVNPKNPHESVRSMPGNPKSPHPAQRQPYVKHMKDGKALDKNGRPVDPKSPNAHIPRDQYRYPHE